METIGSPLLWVGFVAFVLLMLALDLGVFHRKAHAVGFREAAVWSIVWVAIALTFNGWLAWRFGSDKGIEFLTGYLIEKSLSIDNIFVFVVIFGALGVPAAYQHRVLFWGILSALVLRAVMIFSGVALLERFHWLIYVFGAFLIFTGIKLLRQHGEEQSIKDGWMYQLLKRVVPSTERYDGANFFTLEQGKRLATPLFLALVLVELTDVVFALDSIPAIFAITKDPFIVFTSNIFAILGLRALYFLLAGMIERFSYLKVGLALVLVFVGAKMALVELVKIPALASLAIIAAVLGGSLLVSLRKTSGKRPPSQPVSA